MPSIAVIGASNNPEKYGNKAVKAYKKAGFVVYPVNPSEPTILGITCYKSILDIPGKVDMATIYVPPAVGEKVVEEVIRKKVKKVYLNPGSESEAIIQKLMKAKIEPVQACSILAIGYDPHDFT